MAQAAKRISASTLSWQKLSERLTTQHSAELAKLKGQNSTYSAQVNQYEKDLPKIDFAALKKKLPAHTAVLDTLQKQYESLSVPYGEIPANLSKEIDKWAKYNEVRIKLNTLKAEDGAVEAKKVEDKWTRAPPIEQFYSPTQFLEYFGGLYSFYDLRIQNRLPDPYHLGANEKEFHDMLAERFSNYEIKPRPGEGH